MARTTTPKKGGLTVARKNKNFVLTWSPIKNSTDQDVKVYENKKCVGTHDLGASTKKYTHTIDTTKWYPTSGKPKLTKVGFKLARKQSGKTESKYSEVKYFELAKPGTPKYIAVSQDNSNLDTFTYAWDRNVSDGDVSTTKKMFTDFYWETCLVSKDGDADWDLAKTQTITTVNPTTGTRSTGQPSKGTLTGTSIIIAETQAAIAARKRRWFRVRARGPAGYSEYRTYNHQLGEVEQVLIPSERTDFISSDATGTSIELPLDIDKGYPNDSIQIQYAITEPLVTVTTEDDIVKSSLSLPNGFNSWTTVYTFTGAGIPDTCTLKIPEQVVDNNVLFVRINRIHDNSTTYGVPTLMNVSQTTIRSFRLSAPSLNSALVNESDRTVIVDVTNNSGIAGSFIAVYQSVGGDEKIIGIIPSSGPQTQTFPGDWSDGDDPKFGINCFVADYTPSSRQPEGATIYQRCGITYMEAAGIQWEEGLISKPPTITSLTKYDNTTASITWSWDWAQADSAEITWSDNSITWDSTEEPSSYILTNTRNGHRYITGLSSGTYYFRVRFIRTVGDTVTYGKYSETVTLNMSSGPTTPSITISDEDGVVALEDTVTVYWKYQSTDGTPQGFAQLAEATRPNTSSSWTYTDVDASTNTDTHIQFRPIDLEWTEGSEHDICVRLTSGSGELSEGYSEPKHIIVAPLPSISITGVGGQNDAISAYNGSDEAYNYRLTKLPIEFTVSGFGGEGHCNVVIERESDYDLERPDDTTIACLAGDVILSRRYEPDGTNASDNMSISVTINYDDEDLIGHLDESAQYKLTVSITDRYGQSDEAIYPFTVAWDYHAQMPTATIDIDQERDIAIITPGATGAIGNGDYCQIYRMSADKPQLILDNGAFGTSYVDIYPTYGRFGGYRIVYVTKYGDYKTVDNVLAMTEYSKSGNDEDVEQYDKFMVSIRYDDNLVEFPGNISLNHSWAKDFQTTKYLGGSIQGDWNPGVQRTGTINGTIPVEHEFETMYGLRILADYAGICHVRTPEGSNFYGDVQVRDDREEKWTTRISKVSLSYTKVDWVEDELQTYAEWQDNQ